MSNVTPLRSAQEFHALAIGQPNAGSGTSSTANSRSQSKPPYLADLLIDTSPERMAQQLASLKTAVHDSLFVSSKAFRLLTDLEKADSPIACRARHNSARPWRKTRTLSC